MLNSVVPYDANCLGPVPIPRRNHSLHTAMVAESNAGLCSELFLPGEETLPIPCGRAGMLDTHLERRCDDTVAIPSTL